MLNRPNEKATKGDSGFSEVKNTNVNSIIQVKSLNKDQKIRCLSVFDQGSDLFACHNTVKVAGFIHIKYDNGEFVFHT